MLGYRHQRAIDAGKDHDLHKLRLGPSFDRRKTPRLNSDGPEAGTCTHGAHVSDAYIVEGRGGFEGA